MHPRILIKISKNRSDVPLANPVLAIDYVRLVMRNRAIRKLSWSTRAGRKRRWLRPGLAIQPKSDLVLFYGLAARVRVGADRSGLY